MFTKIKRFIKYRIVHIDDSPHRIALGVSAGLFIAWSPVIGLHIPMVLVLSWLLRANKFIAFTFIWVANIFTFIPILYTSYFLGWTIMRHVNPGLQQNPDQASAILSDLFAPANVMTTFYKADFWRQSWQLFAQIGVELWLGSLVAGTAVAIAAYFITAQIIKRHRRRSPHRRYAGY